MARGNLGKEFDPGGFCATVLRRVASSVRGEAEKEASPSFWIGDPDAARTGQVYDLRALARGKEQIRVL
jgi:hypothetical protein